MRNTIFGISCRNQTGSKSGGFSNKLLKIDKIYEGAGTTILGGSQIALYDSFCTLVFLECAITATATYCQDDSGRHHFSVAFSYQTPL
jgi:hypothetical protein